MTYLPIAKKFSKDEFRDYVDTLKWTSWKPKFIVLHNTATPNLNQWINGSATPEERLNNLMHYYKDQLGWHSGPHLFIDPDHIFVMCDLLNDGVHASCFNKRSIGIEMVGDYGSESFIDGSGLQVHNNAVYAMAVLHKALKLVPTPYIYNKKGLHFHKECVQDHHDCPGKHVIKSDVVKEVSDLMKTL